MEILKFSDGFKWGSAASAYQVEGGNYNDWSEWEKSPERIAQLKKEGKNPSDFISGKACDSYNRYEEDFDIAKKLSQNIHRFSIEWSRIEPEEGEFDFEAMKHYQRLVKALRDRGIEPMITLWHFTNPIWFADKGSWLNSKAPEYFTRYVKYVVENLKNEVGLWITFNEAFTVYAALTKLNATWPSRDKGLFKFLKVRKNMAKAHILAYKEIKNLYNDVLNSPLLQSQQENTLQSNFTGDTLETSHNSPFLTFQETSEKGPTLCDTVNGIAQCWVGIAENNVYVPDTKNFLGKWMRRLYKHLRNFYFFKKHLPYYDFIGLNYYHITRKPFFGEKNEIVPKREIMTEMNWEIYPEGIYFVLKDLNRFKKPIFVTENGIADRTDKLREKFIKEHLYWIWRAIQDGVDVRGYLYWSLLDNFEWHKGFAPKFGLVEIDYATLERKIRSSAYEYAKICKSNTIEF